jgi:hypothetical protein
MNQQFLILPVQANTDGDMLEHAIFPVYSDTHLQNVLDYTLDLQE